MARAAVRRSQSAARSAPLADRPGPRALRLAQGRALALGRRPLVMGVLNITPDSFSDGGRWLAPSAAIEHGLTMVEAGAEMLDLGAESTRPGGGVYGGGAPEVSAELELERLLPVLAGLRRATEVPLSVDSRKAPVAAAALAAGADLINDVGGLADPAMAAVVAEARCPIVIMHSRGELATMQRGIRFADLLSEIEAELIERVDVARAAGIEREQIILDPGIGFGKTAAQNLQLLRHLDRLSPLGYPLLIGASRKSFLASVVDTPPDERLPGSLAAAAWAARHGAAILRVHDVAASRQFLEVWAAIDGAGEQS